jgi:prepilin-type N-terminal cleavage/methylation domain-containing protein
MLLKSEIMRGSIGQRGGSAFTLIEILIAVTITSIIFSALCYGVTTGLRLSSASREIMRANQVCLSRMEGLRLCRWDSQLFNTNIVPATFTDYFYPVGMPNQTNSIVTYYGTMTLDTNFMSPAPSYGGRLCLVTVSVIWTNQSSSVTHTQTVTTMVSQNGIQNYIYSH